MREWGLAIEGGVLLGCVWALLAICVGGVVVNCLRSWKVWKSKRHARVLTAAALVAAIVGGTKIGRVTVNDPYISNAGSYVTNECVHVAIAARYPFIPNDMEILIWSRTLQQTNAEDWVRLVRAEEGPFRLYEFPLDIAFPNATNYDFMVAANYVPEPTVHTNGVWSIKGFTIPGGGGTEARHARYGKSAFPNTRIIRKEDE